MESELFGGDGEGAVTVVDDFAGGAADFDFFAQGHAVEDVGHGAAGLGGRGEVGFYC